MEDNTVDISRNGTMQKSLFLTVNALKGVAIKVMADEIALLLFWYSYFSGTGIFGRPKI